MSQNQASSLLMTDEEKIDLLTSAAKAIGLNFKPPEPGFALWPGGLFIDEGKLSGYWWNPLSDDKEKYRLAMECKLFGENAGLLKKHLSQCQADGLPFEEAHGLAIVRAAAEIGKNGVESIPDAGFGCWQPIESAPKDRPILLLRPIRTGGFHVDYGKYDSDQYRPYWDSWMKGMGLWECRQFPPTHWMPLPEAPSAQNHQE